jgi:hypothetical protein
MLKKIIFILMISSVVLFAQDSTQTPARVKNNSIYIGASLFTNTGGIYGIGTELKVTDRVTTSFAIGIPPSGSELPERKSRSFYDVGIKYYLTKKVFFGLNFGLISTEYWALGYSDGIIIEEYKETRGFSFTIGYKIPVYHEKFYVSMFTGVTNKKEANVYRFFDDKHFIPRLGLLIGYNLQNDKKEYIYEND